MIQEDYVSFETAKLLEEKGFDEYCPKSYFKMDKTLKESGFSEWERVNEIKAPTQSLAMKWLREMHMLHIWIGHNNKKHLPWYYEIHNIKTGMVAKIGGVDCGSYETACESAIKYCLENLIKP